jgi:hypothetical protein
MADEKDQQKLEETTSQLKKMNAELKSFSDNIASTFTALGEKLDLSLGSIIQLNLKIDESRATMVKATGGAEGLGSAMAEARKEIGGLGIKYDELSKHTTTAYENIAIFSEASKEAQGAMLGATAALTKMGIAGATTAQNLNLMTKGLGMSASEAAKLNMDIAKVSKSLGSFMTPGKMAQEFSKAAPTLAAYGKNMKEEFFKLASQAKATGMSMQGLLGVASGFDTFEGSAEKTSKLNAMLGTQLNSIDLLMASEADRNRIIKESISATGKSFETLGRFEKKALASAVGISDMGEAAKFFGTSMSELDEAEEAIDPKVVAQQELNKSMRSAVSIAERWTARLEGIRMTLAKTIMPHVMDFFNWMTTAPKGEQSPLSVMVQEIKNFADLVTDNLINPMKKFYKNLDDGTKQTIKKIMGIVLSIAPIASAIGGLMSLIPSMGAVIMGTLSVGFVMFFDEIKTGFNVMKGYALEFWEFLKPFIPAIKTLMMETWNNLKVVLEPLITSLFGDLSQKGEGFVEGMKKKWIELKPQIEMAIQAGLIKWAEFNKKIKPGFEELKRLWKEAEKWMSDPLEMMRQKAVETWRDVFETPIALLKKLENLTPGFAKGFFSALAEWTPFNKDDKDAKNTLTKKHGGGSLVGPAIIRNDEYVVLPPSNGAAGQVMTPQQAAGGADQKPVTLVLNIDGREFVRQTVFPAINKEFNLQGA